MTDKPETTDKANKNYDLFIYRVDQLEKKVDGINSKLDNQDNLKRADLAEFRDTIVYRFNETRENLQKQIDDKADKGTVDDLRTLIKAVASAFTSIVVALIIFYITRGN